MKEPFFNWPRLLALLFWVGASALLMFLIKATVAAAPTWAVGLVALTLVSFGFGVIVGSDAKEWLSRRRGHKNTPDNPG